MLEEYDDRGNCIYERDKKGFEKWCWYDKNSNLTYFRNSDGYERRMKCNKNGDITYFKTSDGEEKWYKYDEYRYKTSIPKDEFERIEKEKIINILLSL